MGFPILTEETKQTIAGVSARFFLIQPDGSIRTRNDFNKLTEFCFQRKDTAQVHARRKRTFIWDKQIGQFV